MKFTEGVNLFENVQEFETCPEKSFAYMDYYLEGGALTYVITMLNDTLAHNAHYSAQARTDCVVALLSRLDSYYSEPTAEQALNIVNALVLDLQREYIIAGGESNPGPTVGSKIAIGISGLSAAVRALPAAGIGRAIVNKLLHWFKLLQPWLPAIPRAIVLAAIIRAIMLSATFIRWKRYCSEAISSTHQRLKVRVYSGILALTSSAPRRDLRRLFKESCVVDMVKHTNVKTHTHPEAATERCIGNTFISSTASMMGRDVYSFEMSVTDGSTVDGRRDYYHAKDLQMPPRIDKMSDNHIIKMVDVDYYADMPTLLGSHDFMLYTFVPVDVAGETTNGTYCVNSDNHIVMSIHGGAKYEHPLWDYDLDHFMVDKWWGSAMYLVESKAISKDRRLVFLNLIRKCYGPLAWFLPGERLRHKRFTHGRIAHLRVMESYENKDKTVSNRIYHSLALINDSTSVRIPDDVLTDAHERVAQSKSPAPSDVERIVLKAQVSNPSHAATVLFLAVTSTDTELIDQLRLKPEVTGTIKRGTGHYQTLAPLVLEDAKPTIRELHNPLCTGIAHPGRSHNNDQSCVSGRVLATSNQKTVYAPFYWNCLYEFVRFVVPEDSVGTCVPNNFDEQYATLKRPSQRGFINALKNFLHYDDRFTVKAFQKAESYAKVTNPRNISTMPHEHNHRLGSFIYPLTDLCKKTCVNSEGLPWFMCGSHPRRISETLHRKFADASSILEGDISRTDGSTPYMFTAVMTAVINRAFPPRDHGEINRLIIKERYSKGVTSTGVRYMNIDQTCSGSNDTTLRTTMGTGYIHYCALRRTMTAKQAWEHLGAIFGDDTIQAHLRELDLVTVYSDMGMVVKVAVRQPGEPVGFLGRIYIDLTSTTCSIIDPSRHFIKLHLTHQPAIVPDNLALWQKAQSYLVTDPNVPVISDWARCVLRVVPEPTARDKERNAKYLTNDHYYWSAFDEAFETTVPVDLVRKIVCNNLGVDGAELDRYVDRIRAIRTFKELREIEPLQIREIKIEIPAVVDGDVRLVSIPKRHHEVLAEQAIDAPPHVTHAEAKHARQVRKRVEHAVGGPNTPRDPKSQLCKFAQSGETCPHAVCRYSHDLVNEPARNIEESGASSATAIATSHRSPSKASAPHGTTPRKRTAIVVAQPGGLSASHGTTPRKRTAYTAVAQPGVRGVKPKTRPATTERASKARLGKPKNGKTNKPKQSRNAPAPTNNAASNRSKAKAPKPSAK